MIISTTLGSVSFTRTVANVVFAAPGGPVASVTGCGPRPASISSMEAHSQNEVALLLEPRYALERFETLHGRRREIGLDHGKHPIRPREPHRRFRIDDHSGLADLISGAVWSRPVNENLAVVVRDANVDRIDYAAEPGVGPETSASRREEPSRWAACS